MPKADFTVVRVGVTYTREQLAGLWGYAGIHGLARGVVTPAGDNKIILFVTENKSADRTPYRDRWDGSVLQWDGPTDHFAEDRMLGVPRNGDEIHVFYRNGQRDPFKYLGRFAVHESQRRAASPSSFRLRPV